MTKPLVKPEVHLADFPYMPLTIARLKSSRAWRICKRKPHLAFYMLNLWMACWHEKPAASLEDDDLTLADVAMCDDETWKDLKKEIMHGWVKCSDGRIYHPVIADLAKEAWERKTARRHQTEAARIAKEKTRLEKLEADRRAIKRLSSRLNNPDHIDDTDDGTSPCERSVTSSVTEAETGSIRKKDMKDMKEGKEYNLSLPPVDAGNAGGQTELAFGMFMAAYPKKIEAKGVRHELGKLIARGVSIDAVVAGAKRYDAETKGRDPVHIASPVKWLLGERWQDYQHLTTPIVSDRTFVRDDGEESDLFSKLAERFLRENGKQPPRINNGWHFPNTWIQELRECVP